MILGEVYKHNGEWKFNAIGKGTTDTCVEDLVRRYKLGMKEILSSIRI